MRQKAKDSACENGAENRYTILLQHEADQRDEERCNTNHTRCQPIHAIDPVDGIHHANRPEPGKQDGRNSSEGDSALVDDQEESTFQSQLAVVSLNYNLPGKQY